MVPFLDIADHFSKAGQTISVAAVISFLLASTLGLLPDRKTYLHYTVGGIHTEHRSSSVAVNCTGAVYCAKMKRSRPSPLFAFALKCI